MNAYLLLKYLHILGATVLFGTGIGIAFFKWMSGRRGDVRSIRSVDELTVLADFVFTTPAVILQPLSGFALAYVAGYPLSSPWLMWALALYLLAGACWLPVVWLQLRMRALARAADAAQQALSPEYARLARYWFWLGVPAFGALLIVYWLMIARPVW